MTGVQTETGILAGDERMLIDGELPFTGSGAKFDVIHPASEQVAGQATDGTVADMERAVERATSGSPARSAARSKVAWDTATAKRATRNTWRPGRSACLSERRARDRRTALPIRPGPSAGAVVVTAVQPSRRQLTTEIARLASDT
ncbi:MAG TPA: hypothetical protein VJ777_19745, partial [Mycobacterium sp.]|nr:hypothetical protein [Mycobacterium sp.]